MIENDAITAVNGRSQTSVLQGNMSITIAQGALLAKAAKTITLQVGNTKLLIAPSGISLEATSIHINPASSGSAIPASLDAKAMDANTQKTKAYCAIQNDLLASDNNLVSRNQKNSTPVQSLDASNTIMCNTHPTKSPSNLLGTCDFYT